MEIIIRSRENEWKTERRLELPGGSPETVLEQPAPVDPPAHVERITFETGYRGFLILTCGACGKSYTVNAREPITETVCKGCGHVTALEEMAAVEMRCRTAGRPGGTRPTASRRTCRPAAFPAGR